MQTQRQAPARPAAATTRPTQEQRNADLLDKMLDRKVTYKPFMSDVEISLTPALVIKYLCTPTKSGAVCDERQASKFCMLCKTRGLNPWEGDAFIVGFDTQAGPQFNLVTAHQAFLKRAEVHPQYDGMESGVLVDRNGELVHLEGDFFEASDKLLGGWARVHCKNRKYPTFRRLKLATFAKGFGRWKDDPGGMIVKCAEADALRSTFPCSISGMYLREEHSEAEPVKVRAPLPTIPRRANGHKQMTDEQPGPTDEQLHDQRTADDYNDANPDTPSGQWSEEDMVDADMIADALERVASATTTVELDAIDQRLIEGEFNDPEGQVAAAVLYKRDEIAKRRTKREPGAEG